MPPIWLIVQFAFVFGWYSVELYTKIRLLQTISSLKRLEQRVVDHPPEAVQAALRRIHQRQDDIERRIAQSKRNHGRL